MKLKTRVYSYIRFSTPEQARGDSLRRQTAAADLWCAERGLMLDTSLRDEGVSAFRGANRDVGVLGRFLALVDAGEIEPGSYLLVESLDRLSREAVLDAAMSLFGLIQKGIRVVTLTDGHEYSRERLQGDWTPLIIALAVMSRANDESRMKSIRVSGAWKKKRDLARDGKVPLTSRTPGWIDVREGKFVINENRETVEAIYLLTVDGYGRREIARQLNEKGVPPFKGKEQRSEGRPPASGWQPSSVAKVLTTRAILGEYQPHVGSHKSSNRVPDGPPILDYYPPVIEENLFWRAQAAMHGRRTSAAGRIGEAGAHILRGLGRCASCGGPMHIINKGAGPKGGIYLRCDKASRKAGCENRRRWRVDALERAVMRALGFVDVEAFHSLDDASSGAAAEVAVLTAQLEQAASFRKRLLQIVKATDREDQEALADYQAAFASEKVLKAKLAAAQASLSRASADPGLVSRLAEATALLKQLDDDEGRRDLRIRLSSVLRGIVDHVECDENLGAVLHLKPWLVGKRMDGTAPYAMRIRIGPDGTRTSVLIEEDIPDAMSNRFFGYPDNWPSDA